MQGNGGWAPLHFLCRDHPDSLTPAIIELLKSNINMQQKDDWTPLHVLCGNHPDRLRECCDPDLTIKN